MLRMDDPALEAVDAGKLRQVARLVAIVAAAHPQEAAREEYARSITLDLDRPFGIRCRPRSADNAVAILDVAVDIVVARDLADVAQDRGAVGDRLGVLPRPEAVAQRVHVGVRAHAGIAEQIPRPTARAAPLEDRVALAGAIRLQMPGGADAREPGADDQHVEMFSDCAVLRCRGNDRVHADFIAESSETGNRLSSYRAAVMMISIRSPSGMTDCTKERTGPWLAGIQVAHASSKAGLLSWSVTTISAFTMRVRSRPASLR